MKTIGRYRRTLHVGREVVTGQCSADRPFVPETRIGFWFLGTETRASHVLAVALGDLERLIPARKRSYPVILDAGCGQGLSFGLLIEHFMTAPPDRD